MTSLKQDLEKVRVTSGPGHPLCGEVYRQSFNNGESVCVRTYVCVCVYTDIYIYK